MSEVHVPPQKAIALQPGDGEALWFMGFLATIKAAGKETAGPRRGHPSPRPPRRRITASCAPPRGRMVLRPGRRADHLGR